VYRCDGCVVGEHKPGYTMRCRDKRGFTGDRDLDGRGTPRDELGESAFADTYKTFVYIGGVHVALDDIEDGYVAASF
jgi:hypothetical protein